MRREPIAEYFRLAVLEILGAKPARGFQVRLANASGISPSYLNDILKRRTDGSEDVRRAMSKALNKSYEELVSRGEELFRIQRQGEKIAAEAENLKGDLEWILTGKGAIKKDGGFPISATPHCIDADALQQIIEWIEDGLVRKNAFLEPGKKARLITLLYDYYVETGKSVRKEVIEKYLSLVT